MNAASALLTHSLTPCTDPDCEVHHPEVGVEEDTVNETQVAFFLAGAQRMAGMLQATMSKYGDDGMELEEAVEMAVYHLRRTFYL